MIKFIKGCHISDSSKLKEEYEIDEDWIIATVNGDKIIKLIKDFIKMQNDDYLFLFIEVPCKIDYENVVKKATEEEPGIIEGNYHNVVYYLDGHSTEFLEKMIDIFSQILVNDGFVLFGVGNHDSGDEIGKYKYNEIKIHYNDNSDKYEELLNKYKITRNDKRVGPWDLINSKNPGITDKYVDEDGKDIYDVIEILSNIDGFVKYEIRDEETGETTEILNN